MATVGLSVAPVGLSVATIRLSVATVMLGVAKVRLSVATDEPTDRLPGRLPLKTFCHHQSLNSRPMLPTNLKKIVSKRLTEGVWSTPPMPSSKT